LVSRLPWDDFLDLRWSECLLDSRHLYMEVSDLLVGMKGRLQHDELQPSRLEEIG
jgi:hypothetical protein